MCQHSIQKHVRDKKTRQILMANGAQSPMPAEKLVTLRQLQGMLEASIKELDDERRTEKFVEKGYLVARFTKATCDAFIGMAGALTEFFGLGEGDKIASLYETASPLAGAVSSKFTGGPGFTAKNVAAAAKGASSTGVALGRQKRRPTRAPCYQPFIGKPTVAP